MKMAICLRKNQKGSLSIEASISLLVFVLACSTLLLLMRDLGYSERVHQQVYGVVQQMAQVDVETNAECFGLANVLLAKAASNEGYQLRVAKTILEKDGSFNVEVSWTSKLPIGGDYHQRYRLSSRLITRGHDGISDSDSQQVFVTETGKKYHLETCLHLRKSSIPIKRKAAIENGYEPCWHCIGGLDPFEKAPGALGN